MFDSFMIDVAILSAYLSVRPSDAVTGKRIVEIISPDSRPTTSVNMGSHHMSVK